MMGTGENSNKSIEIAMIGHKRIPSREGGIEIVVEELSTRMVRCGNGVTCYNRRGHHISGRQFDMENITEYKGVRLKRTLTLNYKGLAAITSSFFGAVQCAFRRYDIVHFHAEGPCAMLWLPKLFGIKCIATIHGLDYQRAKWGKFAGAYIMLGEKCAVKYADNIIVLSEEMRRYFKKVYGRETIFIPNGVSRPNIIEVDLIYSKYGLKKNDYILFLGRIVPEKGLRNLIEAYKEVHTNKKLVIAGGSSDTETFMAELKKLCMGDERIIFTGFVQGQILEELYSNAFLYVLPSELEGMPLSLLEAMSYGNCCLVSDIPECTEVVEEKAFTFKAGNKEKLKLSIQRLCGDEELVNKYKENASDFICSKYSWDDAADKTIQLYRSSLKSTN